MAHKRVTKNGFRDYKTDEDSLRDRNPMAEEFLSSENTERGLQVSPSLYVSGIPDHINKNGLGNIFGEFGKVKSVVLFPKKLNFHSNYGFVNYMMKCDAVRAIKNLNRQPPFFFGVKFQQIASTEQSDVINVHLKCVGEKNERTVTLAKPPLSARPEFQNRKTTEPILEHEQLSSECRTSHQSLTCVECKKPSGWYCKPTRDHLMQKRPVEFSQPPRQPMGCGLSAHNQSHFEQNRTSESSHRAAPVLNFKWSNETPSFTAKSDKSSFFTKEQGDGANNRLFASGMKARQSRVVKPKSVDPKTLNRNESSETYQRSFERGQNLMQPRTNDGAKGHWSRNREPSKIKQPRTNDGAKGHWFRNGEPSKIKQSNQRTDNKREREDSRKSEFKGVTASSYGFEAAREAKDNESPQGASDSLTPTVVSRGTSPIVDAEVFQKTETASATEREIWPLKLQSGERKFEASPIKQFDGRQHQLSTLPIRQPSHETSPCKRQSDGKKRESMASNSNKTNDDSCRERLEKPKNNAPSEVAGNIEETSDPELNCPELKLTLGECRNQSIPVMISHIEKPDIFWCQLVDKMNGNVNIEIACQPDNNFIPKLGCVYAVQFEFDMQWYRGRITQVNENGTYNVHYVDYGNSDEVTRDKIKLLIAPCLQRVAQALKCKMAQVLKTRFSNIEAISSAMLGSQKILVVQQIVHGIPIADLLDKMPESAPTHSSQVGSKVASNNIEAAKLSSPEPAVKPTSVPKSPARAVKTVADLPQPLPLSESIVRAIVAHLENDTIYLQLENIVQLLKELEDSLTAHCYESRVHEYLPAVGELVCARSLLEEAWYRAEVKNISADKVEVFFIDYGNSEILDATRLRAIPDAAANIPQCSVRATLKAVPPISLEELESSFVSVKIVVTDGGLFAELCENDEPTFPSGAATQVESGVTDREFEEVNLLMDDMKPSVLPLGNAVVRFTFIDNRSMMFCLLNDDKTLKALEAIEELVDKYINTDPNTCVPEVGDMLIVYSEDIRKWGRASCIELESDEVRCFLVDYGNICWISLNNCRPFTYVFTKYPMLASHCSLKDDVPDDKFHQIMSLPASTQITVVELENNDTLHIVTL